MQNIKIFVFSYYLFYNIIYNVAKINIFFVSLYCRIAVYIFYSKSVLRCPYRKMWKFSEQRGYNNTHYLFRSMWKAQFLRLLPHVYSGVGHCIVCFCSGPSTAFL